MFGLVDRRERGATTSAHWMEQRIRSAFAATVAVLMVLLVGCQGTSGATRTKAPLRIGSNPWAASISNNPYSPDYVPYNNFAQLGLAAVSDWNRPGQNPYYPELASSWTLASSSVTFHLRPSARWQNGAPFTSNDVTTSFLLAGADYNSVWASITSIVAPTGHTVVVRLQSWAIPQTVLLHLLEVHIVPASQYASLIPSGLQRSIESYWSIYTILQPTAASIANASTSPAGRVLAAVSGRLIKFNPPTLLGNGPYVLTSANLSGILYKKWNDWWDSAAITAPAVQIYPMSVATTYGALLSGTIDFEVDTEFPDPQVTKLNASHVGHYVFIPSPVQQTALVFHLATYPFNLLPVRQAIAYLIDRTKLARLDMGGTLIQDPPAEAPDGINDFLARNYLTQSQFASMNHYPYDPTKAASLLQGAGFTKRGGLWYTPAGSVFTVTIYEPAAIPHVDEDGIVIAQDLKQFGIQADSSDVNLAAYIAQELSGDYAVSENVVDWGQGSPMADFAASFGEPSLPAWNYPISYSGSGPCNCAIGIGPVSDVPGLGRVNIAAELNYEVNAAPPRTWPGYVWDWARWVNQNLPFISLADNSYHEAYSTAHYMEFPPDSQKWLWTGMTGAAQPVLMMQQGYIKAKA